MAVVLAPVWLRLLRDLSAERTARARESERADIAAHLHDSVLQTLSLIRSRADDPDQVARLARAQERELRQWLYSDRPAAGTSVAAALREVAEGLAERVCVGLPPACAGLDADGAAEMRGHVDAAHRAIVLLERSELLARWRAVLRTLAERDRVPGVVRGRCARLLLDDGRLEDDEAARLMGLALSPGTEPGDAAAWIEGFLAGGGMLLAHDERLLGLVDAWLTGIPGESFTDVLPLLRRTFAAYEPGVRRTVGELVRRGPTGPGGPGAAEWETVPGFGAGLDGERADAVLPTLRLLLGTRPAGSAAPAAPEDRKNQKDRKDTTEPAGTARKAVTAR